MVEGRKLCVRLPFGTCLDTHPLYLFTTSDWKDYMSQATIDEITNPFDETTWNDEDRSYFEYVSRMLDEERETWFSNGKPDHAVYLIAEFFKRADKNVRLFTNQMTRETQDKFPVYANPGLIDALKAFLSREGTCFSVITEGSLDKEGDKTDHPIVRAIKDFKKDGKLIGKLEIRQAIPNIISLFKEQDICNNFIVMDQRAIRLETDPDEVKAHVNFGSKKVSKVYIDIFDKYLWPGSVLLERVFPG